MGKIIKAIIWDNAGVLWTTSNKYPWAEMLGVSPEAIYKVMTGHEHDLWDMDEITTDEFYDFLITELGLPKEKKKELYVAFNNSKNVVINRELLTYINNLKGRFILAILTNFPRDWFESGCRNYPEIIEPFDHIITSFEEKLLKPDPKIYQLTLKRIGCKAEEAVFIDDSEKNVIGAQQVGIYGIHFKNSEQAIKELEIVLSTT